MNGGFTPPSGGNYDPSAVAITGGTINGTPIGDATPSTGSFTALASIGDFTLTGSMFGGFGGVSFASSQLNLAAYTSINFSNLQTGESMSFSGFAFTLSNAAKLGWGDVQLSRAASNTLALRNGANAQAFQVYNTFTDESNYELGAISWNSNVLEVGSKASGTGTLRPVNILGSALQINGSSGATATLTAITGITVTNGIVTAITGT